MIVSSNLKQRYDLDLPHLRVLAQKVSETLSAFCIERQLLLTHRIKSLDSVAEKIESGRYKAWDDLDDLFAAMVIIVNRRDENEILAFLSDVFTKERITKSGQVPKDPLTFRFDCTRFYGRLRNPAGLVEPIYRMRFEVQVQTVYEYAWTQTTRWLSYKGPELDWRRKRLSAILKAATEQLDMLVQDSPGTLRLVQDGRDGWVADQARIVRFFKDLRERGMLPSEVEPSSWISFGENVYKALRALGGENPHGRPQSRLKNLTWALKVLDDYFKSVTPETIPRSISLFQLVIRELAKAKGDCTPQNEYYLPISEEMKSTSTPIGLPGSEFAVG